MENNNKSAPKVIKNPLLQSSNYGFPFDSLRTNSLVVPVSRESSSSLTETAEIDSFIGQDTSSPESVASNSVINENPNRSTSQQSVPLVVPSSVESNPQSASARPSFGAFSADNNAGLNSQPVPPSQAQSVSQNYEREPPKFFNTEQFNNTTSSGLLKQQNPPPTSSTAASSNNSYRLGSLKKPTYAPVPGLSSTTHANTQAFASFTPTQNQSSDNPTNVNLNNMMNNFSAGPYNSTTTTMTSGDSINTHRPSAATSAEKSSLYRPVYHHWFYRKDTEKNWYQKEGELKSLWKPFSMADSLALERAYSLPTLSEETIVATDGGRYDVNIVKREKVAVYWEERKSVVRRCSWLSKGYNDNYFVPYEEHIAAKLEEEYKLGMITGLWNRKIDLGNEEVIMHNMTLITQQIKCANVSVEVAADSSIIYRPMRRRSRVKRWIRNSYDSQWATLTNQPSQLKPRIVKRGGFDDFDIDDGEPEKVDHLLFLVHGIGQFCDLKFRSIIEVVDEFRSISLQLTQSHFQESCELGEANRIEILPVSWHKALHSEDTGIDLRLKNITLPSIPRLRDFSNDTILDVLFYTSPVFCQVIINAVASELNRLYGLFLRRNPDFIGKVSIGGHSLGSLIVFDLLSNQPTTPAEPEPDIADDLAEEYDKRLTTMNRRISVVTIGKAGTGQPLIKYPRLNFYPRFFFAFGSPIACFVATRSNEILGEDFRFPTCKGFFNIFHPYDPIAYRIEPLIIPSLSTVKPVQIPHHKGRKRMHLELKDTVSHVGQRLIDTVKNTWNMVYHLAINKSVDAAESVIQQEINHVLQTSEALSKKPVNPNLVPNEPVNEGTNVKVGCLNEGKRIDYVLQEAPVEYFNEYLFALASHLCYWTSRDTMLLVLKEIYGDMGIYTDNQIPQTILPFDITDGESSEEYYNQSSSRDPTLPMNENVNFTKQALKESFCLNMFHVSYSSPFRPANL